MQRPFGVLGPLFSHRVAALQLANWARVFACSVPCSRRGLPIVTPSARDRLFSPFFSDLLAGKLSRC
jgi:hypothetical protein